MVYCTHEPCRSCCSSSGTSSSSHVVASQVQTKEALVQECAEKLCPAQGTWRKLDEHRPNMTPTKRFLRVIPSVGFVALSSSILTVDLGMHHSRAVSANTWISAQQWHEILWHLKQHIHHLSIIVHHLNIYVNCLIHCSDQCSASSIIPFCSVPLGVQQPCASAGGACLTTCRTALKLHDTSWHNRPG